MQNRAWVVLKPTLIEHYKISGYPTIVFVDSDSVEIDRIIGYLPPNEFLSELKRIQRGENTIADYINKTTKNPDDIETWMNLASKYEDRGDLRSALEVWESVTEANIGDAAFVNYKIVEPTDEYWSFTVILLRNIDQV